MPDNPLVIRSDFNLFLMVRRVVGATTYTATLERIVMESDTPNSLFTGLLSGQNYSMSIFATKITGYGSFSSRVLAVNSSTSKSLNDSFFPSLKQKTLTLLFLSSSGNSFWCYRGQHRTKPV